MKSSRKRLSWPDILAIAGFIVGVLLPFLYQIIAQQLPIWIVVIGLIVLLISAIYLGRHWLTRTIQSIQPSLAKLTPWLILALIAINGLILYHTWPSISTISIQFDDTKAALFNSYDHTEGVPHFITVIPNGDKLTWKIYDKGHTGSFSVKANSDLGPTSYQSSGGYITFYGQPIERLLYQTIHFRLKVTDVSGTPDVGIRLAVDNPKASGDRELVSYEIESLVKYGKITEDWQTFDIPIGDFQQVRYEPPFPENLDENKINKLVFFIDNRIGQQCPKITVWASEIEFKP